MHSLKALSHGSHSFTCKLHHACLSFVSIHEMAPPLTWGSRHPVAATYSSVDHEELKGWVFPGWMTYSWRFTHINGHPSATGQAQDREVHRPKTNVLLLCIPWCITHTHRPLPTCQISLKSKKLFVDGRTYGRTFETHFIRSTQKSWPNNNTNNNNSKWSMNFDKRLHHYLVTHCSSK